MASFKSCSGEGETVYKIYDVVIDNCMFCCNSSVNKIIFVNGVKSIGMHAFYGCPNLETVIINGKCGIISTEAFAECNSLVSFIVRDSVESVGYRAFAGCSELSDVGTLFDSVWKLGAMSFFNCKSLVGMYRLPKCKIIEEGAFLGCPIEKMVLRDDVILSLSDGSCYDGDAEYFEAGTAIVKAEQKFTGMNEPLPLSVAFSEG